MVRRWQHLAHIRQHIFLFFYMIGDVVDGAADVLRQQFEEGRDGRIELADAQLAVEEYRTDVNAGEQIFMVGIELFKLDVLAFELRVDRIQFFIDGVQLFVSTLQFFIGGHQFFIGGL